MMWKELWKKSKWAFSLMKSPVIFGVDSFHQDSFFIKKLLRPGIRDNLYGWWKLYAELYRRIWNDIRLSRNKHIRRRVENAMLKLWGIIAFPFFYSVPRSGNLDVNDFHSIFAKVFILNSVRLKSEDGSGIPAINSVTYHVGHRTFVANTEWNGFRIENNNFFLTISFCIFYMFHNAPL